MSDRDEVVKLRAQKTPHKTTGQIAGEYSRLNRENDPTPDASKTAASTPDSGATDAEIVLCVRGEWNNDHAALLSLMAAHERLLDEVERLRLTDAERECLEWAEELAGNCEEFDRVATLRGLLERMGGGR